MGRYLASPDGRLRLILPTDGVPVTESPVRLLLGEQNSFGSIAGMDFVSPVYEVRLGGALPGFAAPVTLAIYADSAQNWVGGQPLIARFDETAQQWQPLATVWDGESRVTSIAISNAGFYALVAGEVAQQLQIFLPHIQN